MSSCNLYGPTFSRKEVGYVILRAFSLAFLKIHVKKPALKCVHSPTDSKYNQLEQLCCCVYNTVCQNRALITRPDVNLVRNQVDGLITLME